MKTKILVALLVIVTAGLMNTVAWAGLNDGLIAYYPLNGDGTDASGNGHDGTVTGSGTSFVPGLFGEAFSSIDTGGHIVTSGNSIGDALTGLSAFSMGCWVKSNITNTDRGYLSVQVPDSGDNGGMRYDSDGGDGDLNLQKIALGTTDGNNAVQLESSVNSQTTEWQHNLMTWSSGEILRFYIDGVLDTPTENDSAKVVTLGGTEDPPTDLHIGKGAKDEGSGESWDGLIDDVRLWSRVLSAEEVVDVFNNNFPTLNVRSPSPANFATNVAITTDLGWDDPLDSDPNAEELIYDVYFGTDPNCPGGTNPKVIDNEDVNVYVIPGDLEYNTTYTWQVDTVDPNLPAGGPIVRESTCFSFKTLPATPVITLQPVDALVILGDPASLTIAATGPAVFDPITFQWHKDGVAVVNGGNISGADTATLTIDPAGFADESNDYTCTASNQAGISDPNSDSAFLRIKQLLAYYKLDTNGNDFSGNGFHGTLIDPNADAGGPGGGGFTTGGQGMLGEALELSGLLAAVQTGPAIADALNGNDSITVSAWVKSNSDATDAGYIHFVNPHNGDDGGMRYDVNGSDHVQKLSIGLPGDNEHSVESSFLSQTTEWQHNVMTWKTGENIKFYINGELDALSEISASPTPTGVLDHYTALYIGRSAKDEDFGLGSANGWNGLIDEVKIYNFALSPLEVASLSFAISGVPVCLEPVPLDTNDDCILNLEEMVEWLETYLECNQVFPNGSASGCIDTSPSIP